MRYLIVFLLIPFTCFSQNNFSEDILWSTMKYGGADCSEYFCTSYFNKFGKDTFINEIQYKTILKSVDSLQTEWTFQGYLREEGQKVFYRKNINDTLDCLLYDFDCSAGDTLVLDCWHYNPYFVVDSISFDEVLGISRKHIYISHVEQLGFEYWIEGIGSIRGILNTGRFHGLVGGDEQLLCCSVNELELFHDPDYINCYLDYKIVNEIKNPNICAEIKTFPNPVNGYLNIKLNTNEKILYIQLCDVMGNFLFQKIEVPTNSIKLDFGSLSNGVYILKIKSSDREFSRKIVIR